MDESRPAAPAITNTPAPEYIDIVFAPCLYQASRSRIACVSVFGIFPRRLVPLGAGDLDSGGIVFLPAFAYREWREVAQVVPDVIPGNDSPIRCNLIEIVVVVVVHTLARLPIRFGAHQCVALSDW